MKRFVEGEDRSQSTLFPERLDDYISEDNSVRAIDAFVEELDLEELGFDSMQPEATGRPGYHPATLLFGRGRMSPSLRSVVAAG
jgi:transposase